MKKGSTVACLGNHHRAVRATDRVYHTVSAQIVAVVADRLLSLCFERLFILRLAADPPQISRQGRLLQMGSQIVPLGHKTVGDIDGIPAIAGSGKLVSALDQGRPRETRVVHAVKLLANMPG